jgi:hypothetical protein
LPTSKGLPSSLVQLRIAVWTGDARDTRPEANIGRCIVRALGFTGPAAAG